MPWLTSCAGCSSCSGCAWAAFTTPNKRRERLDALFGQRPDLRNVFMPLIECIEVLEAQLASSARLLDARAAADPVATRLMSVPGVGPIVALTFKSAIEDPGRFAKSSEAGAYAGLAPRRNQSGERDYNGHISKAGDPMLRSALYEAANSILVRLKRPCALQSWGKGLARNQGAKACPHRRGSQAGSPAPQALAIGNRVLLALTRSAKTDSQNRAISFVLLKVLPRR